MATERLRYDKMVEDALRGVVRKAMREAAAKGLPGDHHFYVTFDTRHSGTVLPDWLRAQYPEQMTIVLQHQFWGLEVEDDQFSVTLSFNNRQERLTVPFAAVASFADPAVKFGLQFETGGEEEPPQPVGKLPAGASPSDPASPPSPNGADVVTLDAFRKK